MHYEIIFVNGQIFGEIFNSGFSWEYTAIDVRVTKVYNFWVFTTAVYTSKDKLFISEKVQYEYGNYTVKNQSVVVQ